MGKKNRGRGGRVVVEAAQDLESFKSGGAAAAAGNSGKAAAVSGDGAAAAREPERHSIESQLKFTVAKLRKDEQRTSLKDLGDHYFYLDNKLIEYYCGCCDEADFSNRERAEVLEDEAFMFYTRSLATELEFVLSLPFVQFWAEVTKDT